MKYDKLVRDKIPEYIESKGGRSFTHVASDEEYWRKLCEKLREETEEFIESETMEEMADILEVAEAICAYKGFKKTRIERSQKT